MAKKRQSEDKEKGPFGILKKKPIRTAIKRILDNYAKTTHREDIW